LPASWLHHDALDVQQRQVLLSARAGGGAADAGPEDRLEDRSWCPSRTKARVGGVRSPTLRRGHFDLFRPGVAGEYTASLGRCPGLRAGRGRARRQGCRCYEQPTRRDLPQSHRSIVARGGPRTLHPESSSPGPSALATVAESVMSAPALAQRQCRLPRPRSWLEACHPGTDVSHAGNRRRNALEGQGRRAGRCRWGTPRWPPSRSAPQARRHQHRLGRPVEDDPRVLPGQHHHPG